MIPLGPPLAEPPFRDSQKKRDEQPKNKPLPRRMPKMMKFEKQPKQPKWAWKWSGLLPCLSVQAW